MNDAGDRSSLFPVYLVISVIFCFIMPVRRANQFRYFIKYVYYAPFAKSVDALRALAEFPGKLYSLSKADRDLRRLRQEILEKNFEIKEISGKLERSGKSFDFKGDDFFLRYKPVPATPYGYLGESSNVFLLKNKNFKAGSVAVSFIEGEWVLLGILMDEGNRSVAACSLTTDKVSRVSVVGSSGKFWAVLVGKSEGSGELDFIWPSREPEIKEGEKILTSGWDGKFPAGLVCGTVQSVIKNRSGEFFTTVATAYNVNNIKSVFIMEKQE
ncbi:MAG: rod shape-determining protein MreC [bacterium]